MFFSFWKRKKQPPTLPGRWVLLPLGNPGEEYVATRHNLGRLILQRWIDNNSLKPTETHRFYCGAAYSLTKGLAAIVPSTYMNLSGKAVAEALKSGFQLDRMMVLHDDKDLPLGTGRLSKSGSSAGHRGIQSIMDVLACGDFVRLRLGIGPFERPLKEWVLEEWTDREWAIIENMDAPFSKIIAALSGNPAVSDLQIQVNSPAFWQ